MSMHAYNAFMASLQEMGLDCSNWSPSVYHDLLRCGDGSAEGLLRAFFDTVSRRTMIFTPANSCFELLTALFVISLSKRVFPCELAQ